MESQVQSQNAHAVQDTQAHLASSFGARGRDVIQRRKDRLWTLSRLRHDELALKLSGLQCSRANQQ